MRASFPALAVSDAFILVVAIVAAAPILATLASLAGDGGALAHIMRTTARSYVGGTLLLCFLSAMIAGALGVGAAALVALFEFPMRRAFSVLLAAPLAVPPYVFAYALSDAFAPFGWASAALGPLLGTAQPVAVKTLPGAAMVIGVTCYPYVYVAARAAMLSRSAALFEAAASLGVGPLGAARRLVAPAIRPAIAGGLLLVMMESAADYGVADYFGVATLSVGIFRTWYGLGDLGAASQLASALFALAMLFAVLEEGSRQGRFADGPRSMGEPKRFALPPAGRLAAALFCATPIAVGFAFPVATLVCKLTGASGVGASRGLVESVLNSSFLAALAAAITIVIAVGLAMAARFATSKFARPALRVATLGYALPGAVVAIGVLVVFDWIGLGAGFAALVFAFAVRFLTAGYTTIAAGLSQIDRSADDAARSLGARPYEAVARIHLPLARRSIAAAGIIVFIECVKELPATLALRPFDFETLSTRVYRLASDERLADAAPAALALIALGLIPALLLATGAESREARRFRKAATGP